MKRNLGEVAERVLIVTCGSVRTVRHLEKWNTGLDTLLLLSVLKRRQTFRQSIYTLANPVAGL
jgi:hypothetical protein